MSLSQKITPRAKALDNHTNHKQKNIIKIKQIYFKEVIIFSNKSFLLLRSINKNKLNKIAVVPEVYGNDEYYLVFFIVL